MLDLLRARISGRYACKSSPRPLTARSGRGTIVHDIGARTAVGYGIHAAGAARDIGLEAPPRLMCEISRGVFVCTPAAARPGQAARRAETSGRKHAPPGPLCGRCAARRPWARAAAQNCAQPPDAGGIEVRRGGALSASGRGGCAAWALGRAGANQAATRRDGRLRRHVTAPQGVGRSALGSPSTHTCGEGEIRASGSPERMTLYLIMYKNHFLE